MRLERAATMRRAVKCDAAGKPAPRAPMGLEPEHKVGVTPVVTLVNADADGGMVASRSLPNGLDHATFSKRKESENTPCPLLGHQVRAARKGR